MTVRTAMRFLISQAASYLYETVIITYFILNT